MSLFLAVGLKLVDWVPWACLDICNAAGFPSRPFFSFDCSSLLGRIRWQCVVFGKCLFCFHKIKVPEGRNGAGTSGSTGGANEPAAGTPATHKSAQTTCMCANYINWVLERSLRQSKAKANPKANGRRCAKWATGKSWNGPLVKLHCLLSSILRMVQQTASISNELFILHPVSPSNKK